MRMSTKRRATADDVRRVALAALATALEDRKEDAKRKPGLTGVRAVATGAVLYTAGRAAFTGRRFIRDHFPSDGRGDDDEHEQALEDGEPRAEKDDDFEEDEELRAEEDDDYEDEPGPDEEEDVEPRAEEEDGYEAEEPEDEGPRAEDEDDYERDDEEDEQPRAEEEDDDYDEDEEPEARSGPSRRPPARPKRKSGEAPQVELPSRPSRSRAPVGT